MVVEGEVLIFCKTVSADADYSTVVNNKYECYRIIMHHKPNGLQATPNSHPSHFASKQARRRKPHSSPPLHKPDTS
jgi:hypothetical protein